MLYLIIALILMVEMGISQSMGRVYLERIEGIPKDVQFSIPIIDNTEKLKNHVPFFNIQSEINDTKASGWIGVNNYGIILYIKVFDNTHVNEKSGSQIWDGDALQIGIDANGDGTNGGTKNEIYVGPNDAMYAFGLNKKEVVSWAHYHGDDKKKGNQTKVKTTICRNEELKATNYQIFFPWEEFNWAFGFSDYLGISVMVNDLDPGRTLTKTKFGNGIGSKFKPGLFVFGKISSSEGEFNSTLLTKSDIWSNWDNAVISIAYKMLCNSSLTIKSGELETAFDLPSSKNNNIRRFNILFNLDLRNTNTTKIDLIWQANKKIIYEESYLLKDRTELIKKFRETIPKKLSVCENYFEKKHLLSLSAIVEKEYQTALIHLKINPNLIKEWALYTTQLTDYLQSAKPFGNRIISGKKAMITAFKASSDNSLQIYRLQFPVNYSPEIDYPLIVDLHGSGNPYVLSFLENYQEHGIDNKEFFNPLETFVLSPWGRGNQAYLGYSGQDIYDCINDVNRNFKINKRKLYLTGFSMGGWGTWYHGLKSPDLWAAIAPCAGSISRDKNLLMMIDNIRNIPILIWHGLNDESVKDAERMYDELQKINDQVEINFVENRGHEFLDKDRIEIYNWLLSHQKKSVNQFSYTIKDSDFNNIHGIKIIDIENTGRLPKIQCLVENQNIYISSIDIISMSVNLHEVFQDSEIEHYIYWNDSLFYTGKSTNEVLLKK